MNHSVYFTQGTSEKMRAKKEWRREQLYSLGNTDMEQVDFLLQVSYDLTPKGFECFVAYFIETQFDYTMFVQGGFFDEGIDIKGARNTNGTREFAVVQCKQWNSYNIGLANVAEFYGRVADIRFLNPNTELFYATTWTYTSNAKAFMDEKRITYLDFDSFLKLKEYVTNEGFSDYLNRHALEVTDTKRDSSQTRILIDTNKDTFELLREVRRQMAKEYKVPAYAVARDQQLCEILKHHPTSLNEFVGIAWFNKFQVSHYGPRFVEIFTGK